jgi:hypothetical protein
VANPGPVSALIERIRAVREQDWQDVSGLALGATAAFAVAVLYYSHHGSRWVFPLDNANLAFHEFGHPFFGAFNEDLRVYGGTLGQLLFPAITAIAFWVRREAASFAVCLIWFCESLFNIARYMADARAHELPLVGGLDPELYHDWTEIFVRWHQLNHDTGIAAFVRAMGWLGIAATLLWLTWTWYRQREED